MKILFLSRWFPYPPDNGSKLRIFHLLEGLAKVHEVHLISFSDRPQQDMQALPADRLRSARLVQWREFDPRSRRSTLGWFSLTPRSLIDTYSAEMEREIRLALTAQPFDLVIASEWAMGAYWKSFRGTPALIEELEVGVPYGQVANAANMRARMRAALTWLKHRRFLRQMLQNGRPCTVVSEQEKRLLASVLGGASSIHVIPNGVDMDAYAAFQAEPRPNSLIFSGSFRYKANYEAMVWFLERVFPLIRAEIPDAHLTITGDHMGLPLPSTDGVTLSGFVDDVRPLVAQAWASIAPLQTGGGTRLKILEAMALRTPVVSTSKGAEGLAVEDGLHLEIADRPEEFAARTLALLRDRARRERLAANAYKLACQQYDWSVILPRFLAVAAAAAGQERDG